MPRLIRATIAALILTFAMGVAAVAPAAAFNRCANERTMVQSVNHARVQRGLRPLETAATLNRAAFSHSRDMLARDYFGHASLSGGGVGTRARRTGYSGRGSSYWALGEVIALGKAYRGTPQSIFRGWMRSSAHRRVILDPRWRDVGVGCARGTFRGVSRVIMYTVDFGRRAQ